MSAKMKIKFLASFIGLICWLSPSLLHADDGGDLANFSGNQALREAIWRLGAFSPPGQEARDKKRSLTVTDLKGLPPLTIDFYFDEPLDPWPESLMLSIVAESGPPPLELVIRDERPFGGSNIICSGLRELAQKPQACQGSDFLLEILQGLSERLLAAHPRLGAIDWRENAPGFEMARVPLRFGARLGQADLFIVRIDPNLYHFRPYHESEFASEPQANILGWADRLKNAIALINGGQYYPNRTYMGALHRDGQKLSPGTHAHWKGFFAANPTANAPQSTPLAAIIDHSDADSSWQAENYHTLMQSFMILADKGEIRVRESKNLAGRAAIGQDSEGRILLIMTPAAITLYDFALALKSPELELESVMGLDGGFETQLLLRQNGKPFLATGQFSINEKRAVYLPGYHPTLPTVLAVEPK